MKNIVKLKNLFFSEFYEFAETFVSIFPGHIGRFLRRYFYSKYLKKAGCNLNFALRCRLQCPQNIEIGSNCEINLGAFFAANSCEKGKIIIGNDVLIGPHVVLHSGNHVFSDSSKKINEQGHLFSPIIIGSNVWIGANVTILSGVNIADGCVIAAGTVVTKNTQSFCVYAGVPAKIIKER